MKIVSNDVVSKQIVETNKETFNRSEWHIWQKSKIEWSHSNGNKVCPTLSKILENSYHKILNPDN